MATKKIETKDFKFTLTDVDEEKGTFKGYASVWGDVDSYGDTVKRGAFKKSLKETKVFPMLWSHNIIEPIGVISGHEDDTGLAVEGSINQDVQRGREVRSLMKQGAVTGLSIGYQTLLEELDKTTGTRVLKEVKLWEISPVVFPACQSAQVTDVKAGDLEVSANGATMKTDIEPGPGKPTSDGDTGRPGNTHLILDGLKFKI